jgi:DNA-directed RNA polymerase specialized sigma24 family protein
MTGRRGAAEDVVQEAFLSLWRSGARYDRTLRDMPAPPRGRVYQVWLIRGDEAPIATHTLFTVPRDGRARVEIAESLEDTDRVLITDEPPRGSDAPMTQPIAGADLT